MQALLTSCTADQPKLHGSMAWSTAVATQLASLLPPVSSIVNSQHSNKSGLFQRKFGSCNSITQHTPVAPISHRVKAKVGGCAELTPIPFLTSLLSWQVLIPLITLASLAVSNLGLGERMEKKIESEKENGMDGRVRSQGGRQHVHLSLIVGFGRQEHRE